MSEIVDQLEALATTAPETLASRVLSATGTGRFYTTLPGPTGELIIGWSAAGIYGVAPVAETKRFLAEHTKGGLEPIASEMSRVQLRQVEAALASGKLGGLTVDLSSLTDFQRAVLRKTADIPPGQLRPYGWVAREIGKPGATRAVGSALNKNPVPVLIPCHRVGRSDGTVGQYAYGPEMKRSLLRFEGVDPDGLDELASRGVRYIGSANTKIYCHPTCHHAQRIKDANRVELASSRSAHAAGFRACLVCRPAVAA